MDLVNADLIAFAEDSDSDEAEALLDAIEDDADDVDILKKAAAFVDYLIKEGIIDPVDRDALLEPPDDGGIPNPDDELDDDDELGEEEEA